MKIGRNRLSLNILHQLTDKVAPISFGIAFSVRYVRGNFLWQGNLLPLIVFAVQIQRARTVVTLDVNLVSS